MQLEDLSLTRTPPPPTYAPPSPTKLTELSLEEEILNNYNLAKQFLESILTDSEVAPNQLAPVINAVTAILKDLVKMQTELYSAEREKRRESALIQVLKTLPEATQDEFFRLYEEALKVTG